MGIFKKPKAPKAADLPPLPPPEAAPLPPKDVDPKVQEARGRQRDIARSAAGESNTDLTKGGLASTDANTIKKKLLGA